METSKLKLSLGYAAICLIWGSTWVMIRIGLDTLTPFISASLRFLTASGIIFLVVKLQNIKIPLDTLSVKLYLFMGILSFTIPFSLVYWAEQYVPSSLTSIIFGAFPFFVFIFSWVMLKTEDAGFLKLVSVIIGFIGILIIFSDGLKVDIANHFYGLAAVFISATMQAYAAVIIKKWGGHLNSFAMNAYPLLIAGSVLFFLSFIFEDYSTWNFTPLAIFSILYLAVLGTISAFTIYYWLLKRMNVVILSLSSFITPIIAIFLGWLVYNEQLSQQVLLGTLFVLIGILFANFKGLSKYYRINLKRIK